MSSKSCGGSMWGFFAADSLAMPVHWFYDVPSIKKIFGAWISGFEAARTNPTCILRLSNIAGSGRQGGAADSPVIGRVILHDKLKYWTNGPANQHYHQGMKAGENTLNALSSLVIAQALKSVDPNRSESDISKLAPTVLAKYVEFVTTPGTHNDTYADSSHRSLFADWDKSGRPTQPQQVYDFAVKRRDNIFASGKADDSQLACISALTMTIPWIIHASSLPKEVCIVMATEFSSLTHPAKSMVPHIKMYASALHAILNGASIKEQADKALKSQLLEGPKYASIYAGIVEEWSNVADESSKRMILQDACANLGIACYINGAARIVYLLAYLYHDNLQGGLLMNVNVGGENVGRGATLGALLGAANPISEKWKQQLVKKNEIEQLIA